MQTPSVRIMCVHIYTLSNSLYTSKLPFWYLKLMLQLITFSLHTGCSNCLDSTWDDVGANKKKNDDINTNTAMADSNDDFFSEEDKSDNKFTNFRHSLEHEVVM